MTREESIQQRVLTPMQVPQDLDGMLGMRDLPNQFASSPEMTGGVMRPQVDSTREAVEGMILDPPTAMEVLEMFEQVQGSKGRYAKLLPPEKGGLPHWPGMNEIIEQRAGGMNEPYSRKGGRRRGSVEVELMMEEIDVERENNRNRQAMKPSQNDYRPNRVLQGSTRTSLVIRRTGAIANQTFYRDELRERERLSAMRAAGSSRASTKTLQKVAAERIQSIFRMWREYLLNNREWITTTRICAMLIQSTWRQYHVRRQKLDRAANKIQPVVRGFLVRSVCKRHAAAIQLQKRIVGVVVRMRIKRMAKAAIMIQRNIRGKIARTYCESLRRLLEGTAICFQRFVRILIAKKKSRKRAQELRDEKIMIKAAVDMQRYFRGQKAREYVDRVRHDHAIMQARHRMATKVASLGRMSRDKKRVDGIRSARLRTMNEAATFIRKIYLCFFQRRRYLAKKNQFEENVQAIMVIQRYLRGFLVRMRMWREAIEAEEKLWGSVEIQRLWRGYVGRLRFEEKYAEVWSQQMASTILQKWIRGWLARLRVRRVRRGMAREEFERARKRFLGAQRIQALMRGKMVRLVMEEYRRRVVAACVRIQATQRGFALRAKLWSQLLHVKAVCFQAGARGFLVRRRRLRLLCCVLVIEKKWRFWRSRHPTVRQRLIAARDLRKFSAITIQKYYKSHAQAVTVNELGELGKDKRYSKATYEVGKEVFSMSKEASTNAEAFREAARSEVEAAREVTRTSLDGLYRRVSVSVGLPTSE